MEMTDDVLPALEYADLALAFFEQGIPVETFIAPSGGIMFTVPIDGTDGLFTVSDFDFEGEVAVLPANSADLTGYVVHVLVPNEDDPHEQLDGGAWLFSVTDLDPGRFVARIAPTLRAVATAIIVGRRTFPSFD